MPREGHCRVLVRATRDLPLFRSRKRYLSGEAYQEDGLALLPLRVSFHAWMMCRRAQGVNGEIAGCKHVYNSTCTHFR